MRIDSAPGTHRDEVTGQPLVSVVVPFFNCEAFLAECIESVLSQTYPHWELLLVDDGSSDGSTAIARQYADSDLERVQYLEHPGRANRGVSASRNVGLRRARGEYIAFLDADDVWLPEKLDRQVEYLGQHADAVMVCGRLLYWYGWTNLPEDVARDHMPDPGVAAGVVLPSPQLLVGMLAGSARAPLPSDALLRIATVREVGGFEEQRTFSVYEDRVFFVKIALSGGILLADQCWMKYRQHDRSSRAVVKRANGRAKARKAYLAWLESYLRQRGYRGSHLWTLTRQYSLPYRHPFAAWALGKLRHARELALSSKHFARSGILHRVGSSVGDAAPDAKRNP